MTEAFEGGAASRGLAMVIAFSKRSRGVPLRRSGGNRSAGVSPAGRKMRPRWPRSHLRTRERHHKMFVVADVFRQRLEAARLAQHTQEDISGVFVWTAHLALF